MKSGPDMKSKLAVLYASCENEFHYGDYIILGKEFARMNGWKEEDIISIAHLQNDVFG